MPHTSYIRFKSGGDKATNRAQGAWYRGVLHFGLELHRVLQAQNTAEVPACLEASEIDWNNLIHLMQNEVIDAPLPAADADGDVKMVIPASSSRKVARPNTRAARKAELKALTSAAELRKKAQSIDKFFEEQKIASQQVSEQTEGTESDTDYGQLILQKLRQK